MSSPRFLLNCLKCRVTLRRFALDRGSLLHGGGIKRSFCNRSDGLVQSAAVQTHLKRLLEEHEGIKVRLNSEPLTDPLRRMLHRKLADLSPVVQIFQDFNMALTDLTHVQALIKETTDAGTQDKQLDELLQDEEQEIHRRIRKLDRSLVQALVPPDADDHSNVILEVTAGRTTGGDICQQFTREMLDMYEGFASYKDWDFQVFNYTPADYGGLHHAAVRIAGEDVYRWLKFEGGTHRVQRIPEVGLSSRMQRIHTGTMTVIILPQPQDVDINIDPKDLRIDTFRSRGAGGQSVNTTDSAVRIVHIPTGTVAECQESRSQLQNRDTAMRVLKARLYQKTMGRQTEERQNARKQQLGTRSQSERIRTYNFSQDRVMDHRIGHVIRDIKELMKGGELLEELILNLQQNAEREALMDLVQNGPQSDQS